MTNNSIIKIKNLTKEYIYKQSKLLIFKNINLDIKENDIISIMGPSGSGKSTMLNILGLLDHADGGQYLLDDEDTTSLTEKKRAALRRRKFGFVFQSFHLVPRMTAAQNVELPLNLDGILPRERRRRPLPLGALRG